MTDFMTDTGGDSGGDLAPPPHQLLPPMITLPPRFSNDTGISPGPMTLVSNFFSDHYPDTDLRSFSQHIDETLTVAAIGDPPDRILYHHDSASSCQKELEDDDEAQNHQDLDSQFDDSKPKFGATITKPANDGYKWRKYGQKQVKASELPRCYYKCTHTDCRATKKIGHFLDGGISDIIYKGQHNHEPPTQAKYGATINQETSFEEKSLDVRPQVNHVVANEVAGDAANLKKRKTELGCVDRDRSSRLMVTESKIVVQTRSEIDILDDGFKWRKYGQKAVKGNSYPRSYYKCAYMGCKVRKQVERVYLDPNSVVTTYEGKHKHDIPVLAKRSSRNEIHVKPERLYYN